MTVEDRIIEKFYTYFWGFLVGGILFLGLLILGFVFRKTPFMNPTITKFSIWRTYILLLFCCIVATFCWYKFIICALDYSNVKNREFLVISGEVIQYNKGVYQNNGTSKYYYPTILDNEGNEVIMDVLDTQLGHRYTFIYLEHTHIAGIVNELVE